MSTDTDGRDIKDLGRSGADAPSGHQPSASAPPLRYGSSRSGVPNAALLERVARKFAMFLYDTWGDAEGVVWSGLSEPEKLKARNAARAALEASGFADLHKALSDLWTQAHQMRDGFGFDEASVDRALENARAALARARGEQP